MQFGLKMYFGFASLQRGETPGGGTCAHHSTTFWLNILLVRSLEDISTQYLKEVGQLMATLAEASCSISAPLKNDARQVFENLVVSIVRN